MKDISFVILLLILLSSCNFKSQEITDFTFNNKELTIKDFNVSDKDKIGYLTDDKDSDKPKKDCLTYYHVKDSSKINLLGIEGNQLIIGCINGIVQDYMFETDKNIEDLYKKIHQKKPNLRSFADGTLRMKTLTDKYFLQFFIYNHDESKTFVEVMYTKDYENTNLNFFKNYDDAVLPDL